MKSVDWTAQKWVWLGEYREIQDRDVLLYFDGRTYLMRRLSKVHVTVDSRGKALNPLHGAHFSYHHPQHLHDPIIERRVFNSCLDLNAV